MPRVSVIIPTYNSAKYISETLDSVLAQTYRDYEIIVVDDGSTDNTYEIIKQYHVNNIQDIQLIEMTNPSKRAQQAQRAELIYIYKQNGGPASARNVGIKNAKGEYIAFLDSDDLWLPEKLEKQVRYFEEHPDVGLVFSDCIRFDEKGLQERRNQKKRFISDDMFVNIWWDNMIATLTVMLRKHCFDKVGIFDESKEVEGSEDWEMWLRIAKEYRLGYLSEPLAKYRVRSGGHCRSNIDRAYKAIKVVFDKYWEDMERKLPNPEKLGRKRLFKHHFDYGFSFFYTGDPQKARKQFKKAVKYDSFNFRAIIYYMATFLPINTITKIKNSYIPYKKIFRPPGTNLNIAAKRNYARLRNLVGAKSNIRLLFIGSGTKPGYGTEELGQELLDKSINLDLSREGIVNVVGDGHILPFRNESFDIVVAQAVLEHAKYPQMIVKEIYRVLKKGGYVYTEVPFIYRYHASPGDFIRYTYEGAANLFSDFLRLDSGIAGGPSSAIANILPYYLAILFSFNLPFLFKVLNVMFRWLFFPVKYIDLHLKNNRYSYIIASAFYFLGSKR